MEEGIVLSDALFRCGRVQSIVFRCKKYSVVLIKNLWHPLLFEYPPKKVFVGKDANDDCCRESEDIGQECFLELAGGKEVGPGHAAQGISDCPEVDELGDSGIDGGIAGYWSLRSIIEIDFLNPIDKQHSNECE